MNNLHPISESHRPLRGTTLDLISQGSKHCLVLDTPFHLAHTDIPFDQVHYFSNLDTIYPEMLLQELRKECIRLQRHHAWSASTSTST